MSKFLQIFIFYLLACYTIWYMHEQHCLMMMCTNGLMHLLCLLSPCWYTRKGQNTYEIIIVCNGNMATLPVNAFFGLVNVCLMPCLFTVINRNTLYIINLQCTYKTFLITCNLVTCFFIINICALYHSCSVIIKVAIIIYHHNPLLFENI